jgi:hypothetical protein
MKDTKIVKIIVDKKNKIIALGGEWDNAAKEGGASESLTKERVIGQNIESYFSGDVTQMYYDAIFKLCRLKNETIEREYRCDSPTHKRYMVMRLIPLGDGSIEMQHETLEETPFEHEIVIQDKTPQVQNGFTSYTKRCSVCNQLQYPNGKKWVSPEELCKEESLHIKVIYTVCSLCKNKTWFPIKSTS